MVILLMPAIYIFFSTLTIWVNDDKGYLLLVRDIYEALVIYAFFKLLCAYVGYNPDKPSKEDIDFKVCTIMGEKGPKPHQFPFKCCLKPLNLVSYEEARKVYRVCKYGILQYIPIKALLAVLTFIAIYKAGEGVLYDICGAFSFLSVCLALYWLVFFFHIFYEDLKPYRPLRKLLIIKGILFLTFWQEQVLNFCGVYMSTSRYIPPQNRADASVILSCLLVDIEMVIMSVLTTFCFSYKDFRIGKEQKLLSIGQIVITKMYAHKLAANAIAKHQVPSSQDNKSINKEKNDESVIQNTNKQNSNVVIEIKELEKNGKSGKFEPETNRKNGKESSDGINKSGMMELEGNSKIEKTVPNSRETSIKPDEFTIKKTLSEDLKEEEESKNHCDVPMFPFGPNMQET